MKLIVSIIILLSAILCLYFVLSKKEKFVDDVQNTTSVSNLDNKMSSILSKLQLQKIKLNSLRRRVNQSD